MLNKEDKKTINRMLYFLVGFILLIAILQGYFHEKDYCALTLRVMQESDDSKTNLLAKCEPSLTQYPARCLCYYKDEQSWSMAFD